jgi:RNA polymerase sigma-70 factor (ECF subfamily)
MRPPTSIEALLRHEAFVRRLARSLAHDAAEADEIVQETWITAIEHPPHHGRKLRSWLSRVVHSRFLNRRRSAERRARHEHQVEPRAAAPSASEEHDAQRVRGRLAGALAQLDARYRIVIELRFLDGPPPREVAKVLGVPVETVRTRTRPSACREPPFFWGRQRSRGSGP